MSRRGWEAKPIGDGTRLEAGRATSLARSTRALPANFCDKQCRKAAMLSGCSAGVAHTLGVREVARSIRASLTNSTVPVSLYSSLERGWSLMTDVLMLNASWEPLRVVSLKKAIVLLLTEKAELVEATEQRLRAQHATFDVPLVIRLVRYVSIKRGGRPIPCSRRGVFIRDRETCQYCGAMPGRKHLTLDHVLPRSRGGVTSWENCVAACEGCNHKKGGKTPAEARMALRSMPEAPKYLAFALLGELERHAVWSKYAI